MKDVQDELKLKIGSLIEEDFKQASIPGMAVGINQNKKEIYRDNFGYRDIEMELEPDSDTVFGIGSITKSMTCMAILQLEERGLLSVNDPVIKYLPQFKTPDHERTKQLTIHHLMTHTTGIPPMPILYHLLQRSIEKDNTPFLNGIESRDKSHPPIDTNKELIEFMKNEHYHFLGPIGQEFNYSNECYGLLGAIIEQVSGLGYEAFVKENIFEPAEMNHTFFNIDGINYDNITTLYSTKMQDNKMEVIPSPLWWDMPACRSAGLAKSTVEDMLKYSEIFQENGKVGNQRILSEASIEKMITPYVKSGPSTYYGYGLNIHPDFHGTKLIEHGGNLKGMSAQMCILPEKKQSTMMLSNLVSAPTRVLSLKLLHAINGRPVPPKNQSFEEISKDDTFLLSYEGKYDTGEGTRFEIKLINNKIHYTTGDVKIPLIYVGEDLFIDDGWEPFSFQFLKDKSGKIDRVLVVNRQVYKVK